MSKRSTKLIILVVAMAICIGASYLVISKENEKKATSTETEATLANFPILSFDPADVKHIYWDYGGWNAFDMSQNDDGSWVAAEDPSVDLDEDFIRETFFGYMSDLHAYKEIEVESLADVGLEEPYSIVHMEMKDGSEIVLEFGDSTTVSGYCYMTFDGGEHVYIVKRNVKTNFGKVLDNFKVTESERGK